MPLNRDILSLLDVPGLENLRAVCDEFGVDFVAVGGLVRNLAQAIFGPDARGPETDLFALTPFTGDIDLVHTGGDDLTPHILSAIYGEVPTADCFRWQVRSAAANAVYWEAVKANGVIPVNLLSLSTKGREGIRDAWGGVRDIRARSYRYIRNGFYGHSPLYRAGRDLEFFSVLLYARVVLEAGVGGTALHGQPGLGDSRAVVFDAAADPRTAIALGESAYLRARLKYLLKNIFFAARSSADAFDLMRVLGFKELFDGLGIPMAWEPPPGPTPLTGVFADTVSAHLGGDLFRLPESDEPWAAGAEAGRVLSDALARGAPDDPSRRAGLGPGQEVLLASPPLPLNLGVAPSSAARGAGRHEFAHFAVAVPDDTWSSLGRYDETDVTAVLGLGAGEGSPTALFPAATVCDIRDWSSRRRPSAKSLRLRINCRGLLESADRIVGCPTPRLRVFVLGWKGFGPEEDDSKTFNVLRQLVLTTQPRS